MAEKVAAALGVVVGVSALPILLVRIVRPRVTPWMLLRRISSALSEHQAAPIEHEWKPLERMPEHFLTAVWLSEDPRFFEHRGFDWRELQRAVRQSRTSGRRARGASTITMQCARTLFLWQTRSWTRKLLEAYYTVLLEALLPKRRILELYVNFVELGDGIYGLEAAARHYFGVPAENLTEDQCRALAVILPAPRVWDPREPTEWLQERQSTLRRDMIFAPSTSEQLRGQRRWEAGSRPGHDAWGPLWIDP